MGFLNILSIPIVTDAYIGKSHRRPVLPTPSSLLCLVDASCHFPFCAQSSDEAVGVLTTGEQHFVVDFLFFPFLDFSQSVLLWCRFADVERIVVFCATVRWRCVTVWLVTLNTEWVHSILVIWYWRCAYTCSNPFCIPGNQCSFVSCALEQTTRGATRYIGSHSLPQHQQGGARNLMN